MQERSGGFLEDFVGWKWGFSLSLFYVFKVGFVRLGMDLNKEMVVNEVWFA